MISVGIKCSGCGWFFPLQLPRMARTHWEELLGGRNMLHCKMTLTTGFTKWKPQHPHPEGLAWGLAMSFCIIQAFQLWGKATVKDCIYKECPFPLGCFWIWELVATARCDGYWRGSRAEQGPQCGESCERSEGEGRRLTHSAWENTSVNPFFKVLSRLSCHASLMLVIHYNILFLEVAGLKLF